MELVPSSVPLTFEVTFDSPDLNVGMSVYNTSADEPILVQGPIAMTSLVGNTYFGDFTPANNINYVIFKAVYTDDTLTELNSAYSQGSESIYGDTIGGDGSSNVVGCELVGYVLPSPWLVGFVEC